MKTVLWEGWELSWPLAAWEPPVWSGGHFGSGREPSSPTFDPQVNGRMHTGIDWACAPRTPLLAIADGQVTDVDFNPGAGNYVTIKHTSPWGTVYWWRALHIDWGGTLVQVGELVQKGQPYALAGTTGSSDGVHLHGELTIAAPYQPWTNHNHVDIEYVFLNQSGRDPQMITTWQKVLKELGYYDGVVDGIPGSKTEAAVTAYATDALKLRNHRHINHPKMEAPTKMNGWVGVDGGWFEKDE